MGKRRGRDIDGILLVDKPLGPTSNDVVVRVRSALNARKAGHCGILDPLATGLLPVCLGRATAVSAYLLDADKSYRTTARFGERTETADTEGEVVERGPADRVAALDRATVEAALASFRGPIDQVPPMFSALKVGGKRLHEIARAGQEIEREPRRVTIHRLEIEGFRAGDATSLPEADLVVHCSKGTYIRSLVEDLGHALGVLAHVRALHRTGVGPWGETSTLHDLEQIEERVRVGGVASCDDRLLPVDSALAGMPRVAVPLAGAQRFVHGQSAGRAPTGVAAGLLVVQCPRGFVGIGEVTHEGIVPRRVLVDPAALGD